MVVTRVVLMVVKRIVTVFYVSYGDSKGDVNDSECDSGINMCSRLEFDPVAIRVTLEATTKVQGEVVVA